MLLNRRTRNSMHGPDRSWIGKSFFLSGTSDLADRDSEYRFYNYAIDKYVDSSLGGGASINPIPQLTPSVDPRAIPRWKYHGNENNTPIHNPDSFSGIGQYYSEAYEDPQQIINIRFGLPQFNSLTTFFTGFYNAEASMIASNGRVSSMMLYWGGRAFGFVLQLKFLPITLLAAAASFTADAIKWLSGKSRSQYYYLKPSMPLYWTAVSNIVNEISVRSGLIKPVFSKDEEAIIGSDAYTNTEDEVSAMSKLMPDIFRANGSVDVPAIINKAQRRAVKRRKLMNEAIKKNLSIEDYVKSVYTGNLSNNKGDEGIGLVEMQDRWFNSGLGNKYEGGDETQEANDVIPPYVEIATDPNKPDNTDWTAINNNYFKRLFDFTQAGLNDGNEFLNFRVDYTGPSDESFSNSVTQSDIQSKINGMSSSSRNTNFSVAGGNIMDNAVVQGVISGAKDFLAGVADQFNVSGLYALAGSAFAVIPQHWDQSSASLPRMNYKVRLVAPHGNPISRLINIHIPLATLLAGALPIASGPQSFKSPFILELYDRGRAQTRLGIIDSLSVSRGVSNLGYTLEGEPLAVDISFSVVDLTNVMTLPIAMNSTLNPTKALFDDDNAYTDYMNVLASASLPDQIYSSTKLNIRMTKTLNAWRNTFSASNHAMYLSNTLPGRLASAFYLGLGQQVPGRWAPDN